MNIKKSNLTPEQLEKKREHMRKINRDRIAKKNLEKEGLKTDLINNKNTEYTANPVMSFNLDETIITNRNQPKTMAKNVAVDKKVKPIAKPVENKKKEETDKRGFIDKMLNFTEIK